MNQPTESTRVILDLPWWNDIRRWAFPLLALAILTSAIVINQTIASVNSQESAEKALAVTSHSVERTKGYTVKRFFSAQIRARQSLSLASEIPGKITRIYVDEGDTVTLDQPLFKMDTQLLDTQFAALLAQQKTIQAEQSLTKKRLKRQRNLNQKSFSSEDKIDELETQLDSLNASMTNLKAKTLETQIRLEKSIVLAPFEAQIQARFVDRGAVINAGTAVLELIENQVLEIQVGLPVSVARQIDFTNDYFVYLEDQQYTAKPLAIFPKVDPITQTQGVKFSIVKKAGLVPGDYVKLEINSFEPTTGFWVPNSALLEGDRGLWQVFAIDEQSRVQKQSVNIIYAGNPNSFVEANLNNGQTFVARGVHRLANDVKVTAKPDITSEISNHPSNLSTIDEGAGQ